MTELQKVLYDYAWEYQIPGLLRASQKEAADNDRMVEAALTRLRGLVRRARTWPSGWRADSSPGQAIQGEARLSGRPVPGPGAGATRRL